MTLQGRNNHLQLEAGSGGGEMRGKFTTMLTRRQVRVEASRCEAGQRGGGEGRETRILGLRRVVLLTVSVQSLPETQHSFGQAPMTQSLGQIRLAWRQNDHLIKILLIHRVARIQDVRTWARHRILSRIINNASKNKK